MIEPSFLNIYRLWLKLKSKFFTAIIKSSFYSFGTKSTIILPIRLVGEKGISIGNNVYIGSGSWLQSLNSHNGNKDTCSVKIGDDVSIAGNCVISSSKSIILEDGVLLARNVYISDHIHKYNEVGTFVQNQGVDKVLSVLIKKGSWIGQNAVITPGVTIGIGSVIGANSFVNKDVPDFCVAGGIPAKVINDFSK